MELRRCHTVSQMQTALPFFLSLIFNAYIWLHMRFTILFCFVNLVYFRSFSSILAQQLLTALVIVKTIHSVILSLYFPRPKVDGNRFIVIVSRYWTVRKYFYYRPISMIWAGVITYRVLVGTSPRIKNILFICSLFIDCIDCS